MREYELPAIFKDLTLPYLSLGEWCLHVFQQTGQVLFTVTHHQKQTEQETNTQLDKSELLFALGL